jgi:hypothetical protein
LLGAAPTRKIRQRRNGAGDEVRQVRGFHRVLAAACYRLRPRRIGTMAAFSFR